MNHGLTKLAEMAEDEEVTGEFAEIQNWIRSEAVQMEHAYYAKHLKRIMDSVVQLHQEGHTAKALELADLVWRGNDRIADSYWRARYREQAKRTLDRIRDKDQRQAVGGRRTGESGEKE